MAARTLLLNTLAVVGLIAPPAAWPQSCLRRNEMPVQVRNAIEAGAQQAAEQVIRGDVAALRANATPALQSSFQAVAAAVNENHSGLAGMTAQPRATYLLETGPAASGDGHFYCGVFNANGLAAGGAEFAIAGLAAGRYAIALQDLTGGRVPYSLTTIYQEIGNGWRLAGFYIHPAAAAGHDGLWFRERAREFKSKGQLHNAWLYYVTAWNLLAPVPFMDTRLLSKITSEAGGSQPHDFPVGDKPGSFAANARSYSLTEVSVYRSETNLDVVLKYSVPSTADFNATQAEARNVAAAFGAQFPELKEAFHNIWAHAVDANGGDVVGGVSLNAAAARADNVLKPTPLPSDIEAVDPALPLWLRGGAGR